MKERDKHLLNFEVVVEQVYVEEAVQPTIVE